MLWTCPVNNNLFSQPHALVSPILHNPSVYKNWVVSILLMSGNALTPLSWKSISGTFSWSKNLKSHDPCPVAMGQRNVIVFLKTILRTIPAFFSIFLVLLVLGAWISSLKCCIRGKTILVIAIHTWWAHCSTWWCGASYIFLTVRIWGHYFPPLFSFYLYPPSIPFMIFQRW